MARLQLMHLPSVPAGDTFQPRLAVVVDQADDWPDSDREALRAFAVELGAQGCLVVSASLDVAQGGSDDEGDEELAQQLGEFIRSAVQEPQQPAKPQLPPPNTTEGKLARSWGGQAKLAAMNEAEGDPQP